MKKNNVILLLTVLLIGLIVVGGTYAFLVLSINATNGNYMATVECFEIDYSINNDDGTKDITGTLFPSATPDRGLFGKVAIKINESCSVTGTGSLKLHINSGTSSTLLQTVKSHCESGITMQTLDDYNTNASCVGAGGTWVTSGTGLKYAVYTNNTATGTPVSKGYLTSSSIGNDLVIYDGFNVDNTELNYYIFIWLDGYITDDTYTNLPFSGYIDASVTQNE